MSIVLWEKKETVAVLTMNNKENRQSLDFANAMIKALDEILEDKEIFAVVIASSDEKNWSQGIDIQWLMERRAADDLNAIRSFIYRMNDVFKKLLLYPLPVIAAVNGHAYAGGFEAVLSCDFAYAVKTARFALTEVTLGIMPGAGGTQNLPRAVGERRAKEIIMSARPFSAQQAYDWGVVNDICEPGELMAKVLDTARTIAGNAPLSIRQVKKSVRYGMQMELKTAYRFEVEAYNHLVETEDRYEGIKAFNEKRKPVFKGK